MSLALAFAGIWKVNMEGEEFTNDDLRFTIVESAKPAAAGTAKSGIVRRMSGSGDESPLPNPLNPLIR
jgi:hypothetical protein